MAFTVFVIAKFPIGSMYILNSFWATICKTVCPMLLDPSPVCLYVYCLSCMPVCRVCNVGVLWPNGWMDQDETWHVALAQATLC